MFMLRNFMDTYQQIAIKMLFTGNSFQSFIVNYLASSIIEQQNGFANHRKVRGLADLNSFVIYNSTLSIISSSKMTISGVYRLKPT